MNQGTFFAQLNEIERLLKSVKLLEERVHNPKYPDSPASFFRKLSYFEVWSTCFRERFFDFHLSDDSLLHFRADSFEPLSISYVYLECPLSPTRPFEDYLRDEYAADEDEIYIQSKRDFSDYFETGIPKAHVTPVRYDFSPTLYDEGRHPASHLHIGHHNDMRVGTKKVLRPLSFFCLILRQMYPVTWSEFCEMNGCDNVAKNVRENLDDVDAAYWNPRDEWEMSLF